MEATRWPGVFQEGRELYTQNARPGERVYGELLRRAGEVEYRQWDPFRSKAAAWLARGGATAPWSGAKTVLYLGGAHGTTVSHLADLLPQGRIFAIEKSPLSFAPLLALARRRANVYPILADAQLPERYASDLGTVEFLYQDIAQRQQTAIFLENARATLAPEGRALLMLKVRSVTQTLPTAAIVRQARRELAEAGFRVASELSLAPFSRDHVALEIVR